MRKDSDYVLDLRKEPNSVNRSSECISGGNQLHILIENPEEDKEEKIIKGVELILIPFIPDQKQGKSQEFPANHIHYEFDQFGEGGINVTVPVIPEYSYKVSGYFKADFGRLRPSEELSLPGEFELLMKQVGCFVRNEYRMTEANSSTGKIYQPNVNSLIDCATLCHLNPNCTEGWSYQIATKHCFFHAEVEIEKLQPGSSIQPHEHTIGWATGLKSCSSIGMKINFLLDVT